MSQKPRFKCKDCGKVTDRTTGPVGSCPGREAVYACHRYEVA